MLTTFLGGFGTVEKMDAPCGFAFEFEYVVMLVCDCPTYGIRRDGKTEIEIGMAIADTSIGIVSTVYIAILEYRITCSEELVGSSLMASPAMVNLMSPPESEMSMIRWVTTMFSRVTGFL